MVKLLFYDYEVMGSSLEKKLLQKGKTMYIRLRVIVPFPSQTRRKRGGSYMHRITHHLVAHHVCDR
jgi:hypothetical protein